MAVTSGAKTRVHAGTALVGIAFLVAACGSSGSKSASSGASAAIKSAGASQAPASSKPPKVAKAGSGGSFCDKARSLDAAQSKDAEALTTGDPKQLEKFEENALSALSGIVASAPSEIKGALATLATGDQKFFDSLKAANFNIAKVSPETLSELQTPEFTQATDKITAYLATTCGISPSAAATP